MNFGVIVAARTGSSRLPQKALLPLLGRPLIVFLLERLKTSRLAGRIVLATTDLAQDEVLARWGREAGVEVFRGSSEDVVARFVAAAREYGFEYVVRVTGDCPLVDGQTLDFCLERCRKWGGFDLASTKGLWPKGVDYEIYKAETMARLHASDRLSPQDREHLTLHMYDHADEFDIRPIDPRPEWAWRGHDLTVDERVDYDFVKGLAEGFGRVGFGLTEIVERLRP